MDIGTTEFMLPALTVQPLVENDGFGFDTKKAPPEDGAIWAYSWCASG